MQWGRQAYFATPDLKKEAWSPGCQARAVWGTLTGRGVTGGSSEPGSPASSVSGSVAEKLRSIPLTVRIVAWFIISLAERCISCVQVPAASEHV